jgi:pilus assembly protein CpaB
MRWNRRATIGVLAIMSGGIAAYAALLYLQARPIRIASGQGQIETTKVVVAARDLPAGSLLGPNDVKTVEWPSKSLPEGIADSQEALMGRGLIRPVDTNEPILKSKLAEPGVGGGLSVTIPEGMRALSIKVDEVIGVAGFVLPGTRVDVILVITPTGNREPISRVILQDVPTLTAGQTTTTDEQGKPLTVSVVTLLVTPGDAEKLALATTQGRIQLALRNTLDQEKVETNGVRVASLLGGPPPARTGRPPSASSPRPTNTEDANASVIEIYRGGVRTLIKY